MDENIDIETLLRNNEISLTTLRNIVRLEQENSQCRVFKRILPSTKECSHLERYYPQDCFNDKVLQEWISYRRINEDALENVSKLIRSLES